MSNTPVEDDEFPQYDIKYEGHARSKFKIDKSEVGALNAFMLEKKWKGELTITYPGNGGISLIVFDEKKPMSEIS